MPWAQNFSQIRAFAVFIFVIFVTNQKIKFRENFCNYLNPKNLSIPKTSFAVFTVYDPNAKAYALCVCGMCLLHLKICFLYHENNILKWVDIWVIPADIYLLKVKNRNIRKVCENCSNLTIKTSVTSFWCLSCQLWTYFIPFFLYFYRWIRTGKCSNGD